MSAPFSVSSELMSGLVASGWIAMPTPARPTSTRVDAARVPDIARSLTSGAVITATSKASPFSIRVLSSAEFANVSVSFCPLAFSNCGASSSINAFVAFELNTVSDWAVAVDAASRQASVRVARIARLFYAVVRRFLRDRDVVHVALAEAGVGDADDLRLALQVGDP